jgi:hypothetical protein
LIGSGYCRSEPNPDPENISSLFGIDKFHEYTEIKNSNFIVNEKKDLLVNFHASKILVIKNWYKIYIGQIPDLGD